MSIFLLVIVFGILLIRSVRREVRQREQLERVTDQLAGANMELKRLDEAKSEFISIASHQLRTPLTAVKGYISMVVEGTYGKLPAAMKRPIQNVYESNERLIRLVNDLLSLSRIESGKIQMQWEKGNIQDIITSVVDELTVKANEKNLKLIFKNPEVRIPQIRLDQDKIRNVVLNLIDNAIKYTEKGSITITAGKKQKVLHLEFADTGAGMTRQEIGKLFQSFTRGDAGARSWTGGSGLGLYVAKQFVIMHKGTIWAESRGKGKGSIFIVELPIP